MSGKNNPCVRYVFKNNPEYKEIKINGQSIPLIDCVSMLEHNRKVLENIRKTNNLWNTIDSHWGSRHYFIDEQQRICGPSETITEFIKNADCVGDDWKKKYLRVLNLDQNVYKKYCELMTWQNTGDDRFENMSCIDQMMRLKAIGNELKRVGMCDNVALTLYRIAIEKWGHDDGSHTACVKDEAHDNLLSQLYNNISIINFKRNNFKKSAVYAKLALILNPKYTKCSTRIMVISKKMNLFEFQRGKIPII